ncbi:hypothetical protein BKA67DRAFT_662344 [Truncatella angustata]|uniref:DRBM domain-containing protein n=1 Tax=Truncatella angustata TaxID=152316 RepID=A0A9P8RKI5_9PEZI|nr:uncharacterized protein BKA67DRAFT_662344 [Truncatella angustata]KAH6647564.1 hypothetical protein BKA67DRAFT_662344 [Truncatella angustata]KAH8193708.1 hypothetical protein TruAng_012124 [Truncatella angustata]
MPSATSQPPAAPSPWQDHLHEKCHEYGWAMPDFQIVSDRRGGRTAWSCIVKVAGAPVKAKFWYDGRNLNNAKEDAAEAAIAWLGNSGY